MAPTDIQPEPSFAELRRRRAFFSQHWNEYLRQYPEQYVAVRNGEVVLASPDLGQLLEGVRVRGWRPRTDVAIEFITNKSDRLLL
jgi:hypothetical protein